MDKLLFNSDDINYFVKNIWVSEFSNNNGGMGAPDLFTLWFILNKYKPKVVVESGVWNGLSTKLIRRTLPDCKLICLDPRDIPVSGYKDESASTEYYMGHEFKDFSDLDLSKYNKNDILCFFDCHQNAYLRLQQCIDKQVNKIFFNDNYPVNCGSHYTIEHLKKYDYRLFFVNEDDKEKMLNKIDIYHVFPNIFPGKIKTGEGYFDCNSFLTSDNNNKNNEIFKIFDIERNKYRWNTFITLK